jgi:hypothetical protein
MGMKRQPQTRNEATSMAHFDPHSFTSRTNNALLSPCSTQPSVHHHQHSGALSLAETVFTVFSRDESVLYLVEVRTYRLGCDRLGEPGREEDGDLSGW